MHSPAVPLDERVEIVRQLLEPRIARGPLRLVTLVVQRGKVHALPRISEEYTRLLNAHRGVVMATVTSAVPLTADETAAIRSRVEAMAGSRVDLRTEVDADLIGGPDDPGPRPASRRLDPRPPRAAARPAPRGHPLPLDRPNGDAMAIRSDEIISIIKSQIADFDGSDGDPQRRDRRRGR